MLQDELLDILVREGHGLRTDELSFAVDRPAVQVLAALTELSDAGLVYPGCEAVTFLFFSWEGVKNCNFLLLSICLAQ